jgi:hypothetical protein
VSSSRIIALGAEPSDRDLEALLISAVGMPLDSDILGDGDRETIVKKPKGPFWASRVVAPPHVLKVNSFQSREGILLFV